MRMTNEEFQAEVFRRSRVYLAERQTRRRRLFAGVLAFAGCFAVVIAAAKLRPLTAKNEAGPTADNAMQAEYASKAEKAEEAYDAEYSEEACAEMNDEQDITQGITFNSSKRTEEKADEAPAEDYKEENEAAQAGAVPDAERPDSELFDYYAIKGMPETLAGMTYAVNDSTELLLNCSRPDVYLIVMESFSSKLMATLGGKSGVAVQLDSLGQEGVLFSNFYANSFRTDRGLVSILSGFPAQPTMSLMKYPHKTAHLPSIAGTLKAEGYDVRYYYGGDADFTHMRSYLVAQGFEHIVSDVDFPVADRLSKWGVPDHLVFERLLGKRNKSLGVFDHQVLFLVYKIP